MTVRQHDDVSVKGMDLSGYDPLPTPKLGGVTTGRHAYGTPVTAIGSANDATIDKELAWMEYDSMVELGADRVTLGKYQRAIELAVLKEFVAHRVRTVTAAQQLAEALAETMKPKRRQKSIKRRKRNAR